MFFHAPTSAITTFSEANAFWIAWMRSPSLTLAFGQYAALWPRRRCSRASSAGSSERRKIGPPSRTRVPAARIGSTAAPAANRNRRVTRNSSSPRLILRCCGRARLVPVQQLGPECAAEGGQHREQDERHQNGGGDSARASENLDHLIDRCFSHAAGFQLFPHGRHYRRFGKHDRRHGERSEER